MANIEGYLSSIKSGIYGEDIRDSIIGALRAMNEINDTVMQTAEARVDQLIERYSPIEYYGELPDPPGDDRKMYAITEVDTFDADSGEFIDGSEYDDEDSSYIVFPVMWSKYVTKPVMLAYKFKYDIDILAGAPEDPDVKDKLLNMIKTGIGIIPVDNGSVPSNPGMDPMEILNKYILSSKVIVSKDTVTGKVGATKTAAVPFDTAAYWLKAPKPEEPVEHCRISRDIVGSGNFIFGVMLSYKYYIYSDEERKWVLLSPDYIKPEQGWGDVRFVNAPSISTQTHVGFNIIRGSYNTNRLLCMVPPKIAVYTTDIFDVKPPYFAMSIPLLQVNSEWTDNTETIRDLVDSIPGMTLLEPSMSDVYINYDEESYETREHVWDTEYLIRYKNNNDYMYLDCDFLNYPKTDHNNIDPTWVTENWTVRKPLSDTASLYIWNSSLNTYISVGGGGSSYPSGDNLEY